jgi:hypothetical protein
MAVFRSVRVESHLPAALDCLWSSIRAKAVGGYWLLYSVLFSGLSVAALLVILTWRALRQPAPLPRAPAGAGYFPTWIEIGTGAAAFAAGILFYALGVRYAPTLNAAVTEKAH